MAGKETLVTDIFSPPRCDDEFDIIDGVFAKNYSRLMSDQSPNMAMLKLLNPFLLHPWIKIKMMPVKIFWQWNLCVTASIHEQDLKSAST